jgi:hypothetical protein
MPAHFPDSVLLDRRDEQSAEQLQEEQGDDRRDVEHPQRRDVAPDRTEDRFGDVDEKPANRGAHPRIEPGKKRATDECDRQSGNDQIDETDEIQLRCPESTDRHRPTPRAHPHPYEYKV